MARRHSKFSVHPAHERMDIFAQDITEHVWREKYSQPEETHPHESMRRVCRGVYAHDTDTHKQDALEAMKKGLWVPGGRIHAGAGTGKVVTLLNCYVCQTIEDSMVSIAESLKDAMLTQQQGGGIGMDFSTLRPSGAYLNRTGATASGPLPFMDMWDAMCATIMSAGSRRGAMMATMRDDHPDLPAFIQAKRQKGRLTNFNVSVLVSDAFMDAVMHNEEWYLGFNVPRADKKHIAIVDKDDGPWYVYATYPAKELWDMIIKNTYEYSEPGVIFIDRVNDYNNLLYAEMISCTNPCGEQPLPPNGACNLGAVNLARMVKDPFGSAPEFDYTLLKKVVRVGVRFLDNVIDVANYPLPAQKQEEIAKRRIGLGITGLGNALAEMKVRYGSEDALQLTEVIMSTIKVAAYEASADLADERGSFPLYHREYWGHTPVVESLPPRVRQKIVDKGIRNGVLLTIAPTGTTSLYMGNVSSGLEPVFAHEVHRKVRQPDGEWKAFTVQDYGYRLFREIHGSAVLPSYMDTHERLTVKDHIRVQSVCQRHVDASVSKTINCPEDMSYEDFKLTYWDAYNLDCKGCTTYRPSEIRGSILSFGQEERRNLAPPARPDELAGKTYKVKWPSTDASYYITINEHEDRPFEMFISSTSGKYADWTTALSLLVSAIMRMGHDISFIPEELKKVISPHDQAWVDGKHYGSLVALIGEILRRHLANGDIVEVEELPPEEIKETTHPIAGVKMCPKCNAFALISQEGCESCTACGFSNCG